jgi:hypothetical protein
VKKADLRNMFKKASMSVFTSTYAVSPGPSSPTASVYSARMAAENTQETLTTLNQHMKMISKLNTPLISCTA